MIARAAKAYAKTVARFPLVIVLLFLFPSVAATFFAVRVGPDSSLDSMLPKTSDTLVEKDRVAELFDISEAAVVGLRFRHDIFDARTLDFLRRVTDRLQSESDDWRIRSVTSLTTVDDLVLDDEGNLLSVNLYEYYRQQSSLHGEEQGVLALRRQVEENPLVQGVMISKDHRATFILVEPDFDYDRSDLAVALYDFLQRMFWEEAKSQGVELERVDVSGIPMISGVSGLYISRDIVMLSGLSVLILLLLLWGYFRNVRGVLLPLTEVLVSLLWTFGLMGILGQNLSWIGVALPVILLAVGIADDLYFLVKFDHNWRELGDRRAAVVKTMEQLFAPHIVTSLTTIVGFLSFASSPLASVRQFAFFACFGVGVTLLFSLLVVPSLLLLLPLRSPPERKSSPRKLVFLRVIAFCQRRWVMWTSLVGLLACLLIAVLGLQVHFSGIELFKTSSRLRVADRHLNEESVGTVVLYVHFSQEDAKLLTSARFLGQLQRLQQRLAADPGVGYTVSLVDYLKRIRQVFAEDARLPEDDETIEQLLFLYEVLDAESLKNVATPTYNDLNLIVFIREPRSDAFKRIRGIVEQFFSEELQPQFEEPIGINFSGQGDFVIEIIDSIVTSQQRGIPLVMLGLTLFLALIFRSGRAVAAALTTSSSSLIFLFGAQTMLRIPLNVVTGMLAGLVAGLGIDYCIHLLTLLEGLRRRRLPPERHRREFDHILNLTGGAVLLNAVSLAAGFMVLLASNFAGVEQLGLMLGVSMVGTAFLVLVFVPRFYARPRASDA